MPAAGRRRACDGTPVLAPAAAGAARERAQRRARPLPVGALQHPHPVCAAQSGGPTVRGRSHRCACCAVHAVHAGVLKPRVLQCAGRPVPGTAALLLAAACSPLLLAAACAACCLATSPWLLPSSHPGVRSLLSRMAHHHGGASSDGGGAGAGAAVEGSFDLVHLCATFGSDPSIMSFAQASRSLGLGRCPSRVERRCTARVWHSIAESDAPPSVPSPAPCSCSAAAKATAAACAPACPPRPPPSPTFAGACAGLRGGAVLC